MYCKKPFAGPEYVLRYLVCIHSPVRSPTAACSSQDASDVQWRDYKDRRHQTKLMTLAAPDHRRFLLHILPERS